MFHGKNASMSAGGFPPARAQASKYAMSHFRRSMSFLSSVWKIEKQNDVSSPLQSDPHPK